MDELSEELKLKAKVILNEDEKTRGSSIISLREWLEENAKDFTCPMNDKFLLKFLRQGKFNQNITRKRLKRYIKIIASEYKGRRAWFNELPLLDEEFKLFLAAKTLIPLGHTKSNSPYILMGRIDDFDPDKFERKTILQMWVMYAIWLSEKPSVQINGLTFISDLGAITMKMFMKFHEMSDSAFISSFLQDCLPVRIEHLILYREPKIIGVIFPIIEPFIQEKIRSRIFRVQDDVTKIQERYDNINTILPEEYGGEGPNIEELINRSKDDFVNFWTNYNDKFEWYKKKSLFSLLGMTI